MSMDWTGLIDVVNTKGLVREQMGSTWGIPVIRSSPGRHAQGTMGKDGTTK
jgi:hypothetical protein